MNRTLSLGFMVATYATLLLAGGLWGLTGEPPPSITLSVGYLGVELYSVVLTLFSSVALLGRLRGMVKFESTILFALGALTVLHALMVFDLGDSMSLTGLRILASAPIAVGMGLAIRELDSQTVQTRLLVMGGGDSVDGQRNSSD